MSSKYRNACLCSNGPQNFNSRATSWLADHRLHTPGLAYHCRLVQNYQNYDIVPAIY